MSQESRYIHNILGLEFNRKSVRGDVRLLVSGKRNVSYTGIYTDILTGTQSAKPH